LARFRFAIHFKQLFCPLKWTLCEYFTHKLTLPIKDKPLYKSQSSLFILISLLSLNANADVNRVDDTGWYAGASIAYASSEIELKNKFIQKENAESFGFYGGYNFTGWFGIEGTLIQTGDVSDNRDNLVKADLFGLSFTPKFTYRFTPNFSVFTKLGVAFISYEEEYDNVLILERDTEETWSGLATNLGIGAQFDIPYGIKIRVSYEVFKGTVGSNDETSYRRIADVDAKVNLTSLSMHYQF